MYSFSHWTQSYFSLKCGKNTQKSQLLTSNQLGYHFISFSHCRVRIWSRDLSIRMPLRPLLVSFIWFPAYSDWFRNGSLSWVGPIRSFSDSPACLSAGVVTLVVSTLSPQHPPLETDGAGRFLEHTCLKSAVLDFCYMILWIPLFSLFILVGFLSHTNKVLKAERSVLYVTWRKY